MLLLRKATVCALAAMVTSIAAEGDRQLSEYNYIDDLSGYFASYKTCFRMKINDNNDDDAEGNSYFYNGKYYAKYKNYVAFDLCSSCGSGCDESTGYVTALDTYVESMVEYVKEYCEKCAQCRRRLEEDDGAVEVDCSKCSSQCSLYSSSSQGGSDEGDYLNCQATFDSDNNKYFQAPTCSDGKLVMGLFHDNECTVKSDHQAETQFDYHTFKTIQQMCFACASSDEACLYQDSTHCFGSTAMKGEQGDDVCKKYSEAIRTVTYSARRKHWNILPGIIICVVFVVIGSFLAHTYYLRHRDKKNVPLANLDHGTDITPQDPASLPAIA